VICKIMRSVVFLSVLISANTYSAETLFYANYEEIDKVVWSYLDKNHPEIRSEELKISVYSFEKVLGTRQEDLINVVLNFKVEHQATKKKKIKMHGKSTFKGSFSNKEQHYRTMTLLIDSGGKVVKETIRKKVSSK